MSPISDAATHLGHVSPEYLRHPLNPLAQGGEHEDRINRVVYLQTKLDGNGSGMGQVSSVRGHDVNPNDPGTARGSIAILNTPQAEARCAPGQHRRRAGLAKLAQYRRTPGPSYAEKDGPKEPGDGRAGGAKNR